MTLSVYVTVCDAIGDLPALSAGECDPDDDEMHQAPNHRVTTVDTIRGTPSGESPDGYAYESDRRLHSDRPAYTIEARSSTYRNTHPCQPRGITHRERARLQSFPDDFEFSGNLTQVKEQLGNAVPPLLARCFAEVIV